MHYDATITAKGQTTIPSALRKKLKLQPGDRIAFIEKGGEIVIQRQPRSALELAGILHDPDRKALSLEEIKGAWPEAAIERYERSLDRD